MVYRSFFLVLGLIFLSFLSYGQKVKYKDLFLLLNAKEYDQAEPFLRKFLKDNPDHPNALLNMATIYHDKSNKEDLLKQTELVTHHMDSAVIFYEKALKEVDEKEVKKNDEYYESYKRRDLKTGEFTVKFSDVQYDITKKIQGLKDRKSRIFELKEQFATAQAYYGKSVVLYQGLQAKYDSQKDMLLRSDDGTIATLSRITTSFDSSMMAFKSYKSTAQILGKFGHNQVLTLQEIKDFKKDGINPYDFLQEDLKLWDFKTFSETSLLTIEKEIKPMREAMIAFDIELNKLSDRVKKDSVDVRLELGQLLQKSPTPTMKKTDPDPLPAAIFDMKIADLYYGSELASHRLTNDTVNVSLQLARVDAELKKITKLDSITKKLVARDIDKDCQSYQNFVTTAYGTPEVLKSLVKTTADFAAREKLKRQKDWENRSQALKWLVSATDSIPLFTEDVSSRSKFKPLIVQTDQYTLGLHYADSIATGYFYSITPSRVPDIKAVFPVDKVHFTRRNLPLIKAITTKDDKGMVYFGAIYSENKVKDKFSVVIAKIYRSDGLAWSRTYMFDMLPTALIFDPGSGELSVKIAGAAGDSKIVTLDKNGKQLQ